MTKPETDLEKSWRALLSLQREILVQQKRQSRRLSDISNMLVVWLILTVLSIIAAVAVLLGWVPF